MNVADQFRTFLSNITLTGRQRSDGETSWQNVADCLNRHYYQTGGTGKSQLIGSWGKGTRVRPPRDIDILFEIPYAVYLRFEQRTTNKQSALLQEVKGVLVQRFPTTDVKGDGPVVLVPFGGPFEIEVVPAIRLTDGRHWICITKDGGRYKVFDAAAELAHIDTSNQSTGNKTRDLTRMLKVWQAECRVVIKSFHLELLAVEFLRSWQHRDKSHMYYDWMVRDFFSFLKGRAWTYVTVPGTGEQILLLDAWGSKASTAHANAISACDNEAGNYHHLALVDWQKIFGTYIQ